MGHIATMDIYADFAVHVDLVISRRWLVLQNEIEFAQYAQKARSVQMVPTVICCESNIVVVESETYKGH